MTQRKTYIQGLNREKFALLAGQKPQTEYVGKCCFEFDKVS